MARRIAVEYLAANFDAYAAKGHAVANASFLRALVRHAPELDLACLSSEPSASDSFYELVGGFGYRGPQHASPHLALEQLDPSVVLLPHLQLAELAWLRRRFGQRRLSLCGLIHGLAGQATAHVAGLVSAPLQAWDAIVATSRASVKALTFTLDGQADYLRERFGATRVPKPYCALIPLGVDVEAFRVSRDTRERTRGALGIADDEIVLLSVARRSFHAKAHPTALYRAAEQVAARTAMPIKLIECGQPGSAAIDRAHDEEAARLCPSVRRTALPAMRPEELPALYAAGDIFVALVDNFQETFGLAVVEAMAAGLPVVASDWDGLRDTVLDGLTGFLIPTMQPPALFGEDLAVRLWLGVDNEDVYKGNTCQFVAVDADRAASALFHLASDPMLRRRMGEAGRERASTIFDWSRIIPQHLDLWDELQTVRARAEDVMPRRAGTQSHPAYPDPFALFASYPSLHLSRTCRVVAGPRGHDELPAVLASVTNAYVAPLLPDITELTELLERIGGAAMPIDDLLRPVREDRRWLLFRSLCFLAKHGLVRVAT